MDARHLFAIALAVASALSLGTADALQLREAITIPAEQALRPGLVWRLVRRSRWLWGAVCDAAGFILLTVAIWQGSLVLVYPLVTLALVWTLGLLAVWFRDPLGRREWLAVLAVVAGVGLFVAATGSRHEQVSNASGVGWVALALGGAAVLAGAGALALRSVGRRRAVLFAVAGGLAEAILAALMAGLSTRFDLGFMAVLTSWEVYAVIGAGVIDVLYKQTAYQAGYPTITLPIMRVMDPLLAVLFGSMLFNEQAWAHGASFAPALVGLAAMSGGLIRLGREPRLAVDRST